MLDDLDRALIHALRVNARAPFSHIGEVLGMSPQTVARRYGRLRSQRLIRVVGLADVHATGQTQWIVRITASPSTAQELAHALVRRTNTSWVRLASGGTEIVATVHASADNRDHSLLLQDIPRTAGITSVSAHCVLHTYLGGRTAWRGTTGTLTDQQLSQLAPTDGADAIPPRTTPHRLTSADNDLLAALQRDGRCNIAGLAAATGWSPATVGRRLAELQRSGALYFDVEINPALFGATTQALIWATVRPTQLEEIAATLAQHEELAYVAATTGSSNVVAYAMCASPAHLHDYLVRGIGAFDAIHALESAPVMQTLKASSPVTHTDPTVSRSMPLSRSLTVPVGPRSAGTNGLGPRLPAAALAAK
jgi:DNA-binding Lrp family transcriptional regulator